MTDSLPPRFYEISAGKYTARGEDTPAHVFDLSAITGMEFIPQNGDRKGWAIIATYGVPQRRELWIGSTKDAWLAYEDFKSAWMRWSEAAPPLAMGGQHDA